MRIALKTRTINEYGLNHSDTSDTIHLTKIKQHDYRRRLYSSTHAFHVSGNDDSGDGNEVAELRRRLTLANKGYSALEI